MPDAIKKQVEGEPLKPKPESATERRHRETMRALNGEIPNAVYESKRELVELLNLQDERKSRFFRDNHTIQMDLLTDILNEHQTFHGEWRDTQTRLEGQNKRVSRLYTVTNVLRLVVNAGIFVVLVMYLMDMG